MKRLSSNRIGVDQGSLMLFSDFADGGEMWAGKGARERRRRVTFSETYLEPPSVTVGISMFDLDRMTNQRSDISAENITAQGFEIVFRTWSDTRIARVRADWMAIGALRDDDMWEVD